MIESTFIESLRILASTAIMFFGLAITISILFSIVLSLRDDYRFNMSSIYNKIMAMITVIITTIVTMSLIKNPDAIKSIGEFINKALNSSNETSIVSKPTSDDFKTFINIIGTATIFTIIGVIATVVGVYVKNKAKQYKLEKEKAYLESLPKLGKILK